MEEPEDSALVGDKGLVLKVLVWGYSVRYSLTQHLPGRAIIFMAVEQSVKKQLLMLIV